MSSHERFCEIQKPADVQISAAVRRNSDTSVARERCRTMARMLLTALNMRPSTPFSVGPTFLALLVAVAGAASCGSVTARAPDGGAAGTGGSAGHVTTGTAGAQAGANGTAGSQDGGAGAAGGSTNVDASLDREPGCPGTAVVPIGTCTPSQVCEYRASDADPTCVTRLDCYASGTNAEPSWHLTQADPTCGTRPASCPSTYAAVVEGTACSVQDTAACDYADGRCSCLPCSPSTGTSARGVWSCRAWNSGGTGCPAISPLAGTACATPNQFCTYGGFCSISVGDDLECKDGFWQQMISPQGTCALRACPTTGVDAGADHPPDTCAQAADCPGGTCWEGLNGTKACVTPVPSPTLMTCQTADTTCCLKEADCTQSTNGRCLPLLDVKENFCGGAIPLGNVCRYDQCRGDADCTAQAPAGATVSACVPSGAFGLYNATCVYGGCRTDADCSLHPGGSCQYGQAATNGVCSLRNVLFSAYPSDSCQVTNNATTGCPSGKICVPKSSYQGRECGAPPPEYP